MSRKIRFPADADLAIVKLPLWNPRLAGLGAVDTHADVRRWDGQVVEVLEEITDDTGAPFMVLLLTRDGYVIRVYADEIRSVEPDDHPGT